MPNQEAETVNEILVREWVCRFGLPKFIHSDQGTNFESRVFQKVCEILGIDKTRTTPGRPQSDGMVERFNRTMMNIVTSLVAKDQRDWDLQVQFAVHGSLNRPFWYTLVLFAQCPLYHFCEHRD